MINECFYDEKGILVDKNHKWSGCAGTPNEYVGIGILGNINHALFNSGGLCDLNSWNWKYGACSIALKALITTYKYAPEWIKN